MISLSEKLHKVQTTSTNRNQAPFHNKQKAFVRFPEWKFLPQTDALTNDYYLLEPTGPLSNRHDMSWYPCLSKGDSYSGSKDLSGACVFLHQWAERRFAGKENKVKKSNKMIGQFDDKPITESYRQLIDVFVSSLGGAEKRLTSLISYSVKRKSPWMWAYGKTPDGTLCLIVLLDEPLAGEQFKYVKQVSKNRWNHHVVITSAEMCQSQWLKNLIRSGFEFSQK